jgi:hypothetical protein
VEQRSTHARAGPLLPAESTDPQTPTDEVALHEEHRGDTPLSCSWGCCRRGHWEAHAHARPSRWTPYDEQGPVGYRQGTRRSLGSEPRHRRDGRAGGGKTAGTRASAATGGTIAKVRQQGTEMALDFEDGSTMWIPLAETTASVTVRAHNHTLEYAD